MSSKAHCTIDFFQSIMRKQGKTAPIGTLTNKDHFPVFVSQLIGLSRLFSCLCNKMLLQYHLRKIVSKDVQLDCIF